MAANNNCSFIGRLTADVEVRELNDGKKVASFTLAVNRRTRNDHPEADFIRCNAWDGTAEVLEKYTHKGSLISVAGELRQKNYTDKDGIKRTAFELVVRDIQLLTPKSEKAEESSSEHSYPQKSVSPAKREVAENEEDDDDTPY